MGNFASLVEASLPLPSVIEWDGDESVPFAVAHMLIVSFGEPFSELFEVVVFLPVLEPDDGIDDLAVDLITGPVPFEMPVVPGAVGANEVGGGIGLEAGEGFTALAAKGGFNPDGRGQGRFRPREGKVQGAVDPFSGKTDG